MKPGASCVNRKARESIFQTHFVTTLLSLEMPDTKAEDEVDFLSNTRESSVSEEAALGNRTSTPEVKQGLKTQAVSLSEHKMCLSLLCVSALWRYLGDFLKFTVGFFPFSPVP